MNKVNWCRYHWVKLVCLFPYNFCLCTPPGNELVLCGALICVVKICFSFCSNMLRVGINIYVSCKIYMSVPPVRLVFIILLLCNQTSHFNFFVCWAKPVVRHKAFVRNNAQDTFVENPIFRRPLDPCGHPPGIRTSRVDLCQMCNVHLLVAWVVCVNAGACGSMEYVGEDSMHSFYLATTVSLPSGSQIPSVLQPQRAWCLSDGKRRVPPCEMCLLWGHDTSW